MQYRPQLDSLRALAVAGVLFSHFWMPASFAGSLGVQVFFVLSGFLITSILLQRPVLGTFFRRRALRLLPAFYIAVLGALVFNLPGMRDSWPWHVLQASNFYFALNNSWATPWPANHLWSLNVEEQFYVIWPLVLLLPRTLLPWAIGCFIMAAPIFRNLAPGVWAETMPIASFDALAGGGLIALFPRRIFYLGFAAAPVVLWGLISVAEWDGVFAAASVLFAFAVVLAAYNGALTLLDRPEIIWLGRISYGVYLYHLFVWAGIRGLGWGASPGWKTMLACSGATIMVAAPSYYFLERPILRKFGQPGAAGRAKADQERP